MLNNLFRKFKKNKSKVEEIIDEREVKSDLEYNHICDMLDKIYNKQNKQNIVIDDILENIEENLNYNEELKEKIREYENSEEKMIDLIISSINYLNLINKYMGKNENIDINWATQMNLIEKNINNKMLKCGLVIISEANVTVDTSLHHVLNAVYVNDRALDSTVKEVIENGYVYKDKVIRKAKIIANVYKEDYYG